MGKELGVWLFFYLGQSTRSWYERALRVCGIVDSMNYHNDINHGCCPRGLFGVSLFVQQRTSISISRIRHPPSNCLQTKFFAPPKSRNVDSHSPRRTVAEGARYRLRQHSVRRGDGEPWPSSSFRVRCRSP